MSWDLRLKTPFNCIISGTSQSGKTTFIKNLLLMRDTIFSENPTEILLFYKINQPIYDEMLENKIIDKIIDISTFEFSIENVLNLIEKNKDKNGSMIIFDDSMTDIAKNFEEVFTNVSHHHKCSIIFVTQNLFYKDKSYRSMSLNTHYFVIMKNSRDLQQVSTLSRQMSVRNSTYVIQSYLEATKKPYHYLLFDFRPETPPALKLRSCILPHEFPYTIYLEK